VEQQSNKPKLQSRNPSSPISRFSAFLFPLGFIGVVALIRRRTHQKSKRHVILCANQITYPRLGADRFTTGLGLGLGLGLGRRWPGWHVHEERRKSGWKTQTEASRRSAPEIRVPYMLDPRTAPGHSCL
jgi:hypothetical protein